MSSEIFVYASVVKDVIYALCMLGLFFILKFDTWWVWVAHSGIWVVAFFYYTSDSTMFWFPTIAGVLSTAIVAVDAWILLVTSCYLFGHVCCIGDDVTSPFSMGFHVCGAGDRHQTESLIYIAMTTIGLGMLSGIGRTSSIMNTRAASSYEMLYCTVFAGVKVWMLFWYNVSFSSFFVTQTFVTIALNTLAVFLSYKYKFASTIIFLSVVGIDLLVLLGATDALKFAESTLSDAGIHFSTRRHLLAQEHARASTSLTNYLASDSRAALTFAANTLSVFDATNGPEAGRATLDDAIGALESFNLGVQLACRDAAAEAPGFACIQAHASALSLYTIAGDMPCCERGTRFDLTISGLAAKLSTLDDNFNNIWKSEMDAFLLQTTAAATQAAMLNLEALESLANKIPDFHDTRRIISDAIKRVWYRLIGKNVTTQQTPWVTSTGLVVPNTIKWIWISIHVACILITLFEMFNSWARSRDLKTPFGAQRASKQKNEEMEDVKSPNKQTGPSITTPRRRTPFSNAFTL
jgi:hypothetical protein